MQISLYPAYIQFGERGQDARARARPGDGLAAAGANHHTQPTGICRHMDEQASKWCFSPPPQHTSSFERAKTTNDTKISLPTLHQQHFF